MVPTWVMIIFWAYLEPLVITRLITAVSAIKLPWLWLDVFTLLCNMLNFVVFFTWEENLAKFRKFSQEMEYTRAKWTRYDGHMTKAKGEHNSQLRLFLTQTSFGGPLQFKYPSFTVSLTLKPIHAQLRLPPKSTWASSSLKDEHTAGSLVPTRSRRSLPYPGTSL